MALDTMTASADNAAPDFREQASRLRKAPYREGVIHIGDASLSIWEEPGQMPVLPRDAWEIRFKRDVFARMVQMLHRLGWTCALPEISSHDVKRYGGRIARRAAERRRFCTKGDLKADLEISGRTISLKMFQSVNCPTRPDYEGRYESNKEAAMPYVLRLEMERTRRRLTAYLCAVFGGYSVEPTKVTSPSPYPLAYFDAHWAPHRFKRDATGWPDLSELNHWRREDRDGVQLCHGDVRWTRSRSGGLLRGRVYGGINGMWTFVYGPGVRDFMTCSASEFFTYAGHARKVVADDVRRKRLEAELKAAIGAMRFERAAVLRDTLHPKSAPAAPSAARDLTGPSIGVAAGAVATVHGGGES